MNDYLLPFFMRQVSFRALGEAIANAYSNQLIRCPIHLSIGQEYWLPYVLPNYSLGDRYFSSHRSHSLYMALNGDVKSLIAELYGHADGCLGGLGGSMHLKSISKGLISSNPIVASSIPQAVGSSLASQHLQDNTLTVTYFGDGACEEGSFHESLNFSSVHSLPILFICENNGFSCNTSLRRRQSDESMSRFAVAHNINHALIDHYMDPMDIKVIVDNAYSEARSQPFFLEIKSNRIYQHCGHLMDLNTGDRIEAEQVKINSSDPTSSLIASNSSLNSHYHDCMDEYNSLISFYSLQNSHYLDA